MSSVMNVACLVDSVLLVNTFVVMSLAVGVPTLSGYSTFWLAMVILTLCLFVLESQIKQGSDFFTVWDTGDGNEDKCVCTFGDAVAQLKLTSFMGKGIVPRFAALALDRACKELFDTDLFAGE